MVSVSLIVYLSCLCNGLNIQDTLLEVLLPETNEVKHDKKIVNT